MGNATNAVMAAKYFVLTAIRVLTLDSEGVPSVNTVDAATDSFKALIATLGKTARETLSRGKPVVVGRQPTQDDVSVGQVMAFGYDPAVHTVVPDGSTLYPVGETVTGHVANGRWAERHNINILDVLGWGTGSEDSDSEDS